MTRRAPLVAFALCAGAFAAAPLLGPGCALDASGDDDHHGEEDPDDLGVSVSGLTLSALDARSGCTTAGTEGISRQLLDEMMCLSDGRLVRFSHPNLRLASSRVHPFLSPAGRDMLERVARSRVVEISSALRTLAEQYVLKGGCAVAADPGRSNHETGRAIDVSNYGAVGGALTSAGFGHPLPSSDPVHYEAPGDDLRRLSVRAFQRLWNANHPGDRIAEDGAAGPQTLARLGRSPAEGFAVGRVCGVCTPAREVCNGRDDDCDGRVDEGVTNACGRCGEVPREVCNGRDDDCDGRVDEGVTNACGRCGEVPREVCNGRDDDCDGDTDEDVCDRASVRAELPPALDLGESVELEVVVENAGTTRWSPPRYALLARAAGASLSIAGALEDDVPPGGSLALGLTLTPDSEGEVTLTLGVSRDGRAVEGTLESVVPARRPPFGATFLDVSAPAAAAPRARIVGWALVRNEGREPWPEGTRLTVLEGSLVADALAAEVPPGVAARLGFELTAPPTGTLERTLALQDRGGRVARWPDPSFPLRIEIRPEASPAGDRSPSEADPEGDTIGGGCSTASRRPAAGLPVLLVPALVIGARLRRSRRPRSRARGRSAPRG